MYNQMYRKYLIKNDFWMTKKKNGNGTWFVKHTPEHGGVYAKLLQKGVEIHVGNEKEVFTNFNDLDGYLDRLSSQSNQLGGNELFSLLNRKMTSKALRSLPLI